MLTEIILQELTEDAVIDILDEFGSPVYTRGTTSDGKRFLTFKTVCHGGDSSKLYYYVETKTFHCYTNCGTMNIFELVKRVKGYEDSQFPLILTYLSSKLGIKPNTERNSVGGDISVGKRKKEIDFMENRRVEKMNRFSGCINIKKYDPTILEYFDKKTFYEGWINEGISIASMQKFGISYYWLENHIIIPHYNDKGELVGIRRRSLKPEDVNNKYMPEIIEGFSYGHPLGVNLYGLDKNACAIRKKQKALIVEGEKSVLLSDTYYGNDSIALATCGFNISDWQIRKLLEMHVSEIYLAFDKDYDILKEDEYKKDPSLWKGYEYYLKRLQILSDRITNKFKVYLILDKKDLLQLKDSPLDRGKEIFEELLKDAKKRGPVKEKIYI